MEFEVTIRFLPLEDKQKIGKFSELLTILSTKCETVRKLTWRLTNAAVKTVELLVVAANHHRDRQ